MKKSVQFLAIAIMAASIVFTSCGGGGDNAANGTADSTAADATPATLMVDPSASAITWTGEMMGIYAHHGTIKLTSGEVTMAGANVTGGKFVVDMKSIAPTDSNYDASKGNTPEKLVGHLSSGDFFAVDSNPTASFEITKVEGNVATGKLTVRGVTNEEQVKDVAIAQEGDMYKMTGNLTFDRQKYGVAYKAAKDMILNDNIKLAINIIAKK